MNTALKEVYYCEYCGKRLYSKHNMLRHEKKCWKKDKKSPEDVLREISKKTGIAIEDITSPSERRGIADARLNFYRRCKDHGFTDQEIADSVQRKRSAVTNGRKTAETVPDLIEQYERYFNEK